MELVREVTETFTITSFELTGEGYLVACLISTLLAIVSFHFSMKCLCDEIGLLLFVVFIMLAVLSIGFFFLGVSNLIM